MRRIFTDDILEKEISTKGFIIINNFASDSLCDTLIDFHSRSHTHSENQFTISNWSTDQGYRKKTYTEISTLLLPLASKLLYSYKPLMGVYTVKQPGPTSDMLLHQDWSLVDESRYRSLSIWTALCDMDNTNGNLQVAPQSHLYAGTPRGMNVPVPFEDIRTDMLDLTMLDLPLRKGDAIIFDHRLIHASPANLSQNLRLAAVLALIPEEAELIHYYFDPLKKDELEILRLNEEQFRLMDFFDTSVKPPHVDTLGSIPYSYSPTKISDAIKAREKVRFEYPFFRDITIQKEVATNGYSVQPLLNSDEIAKLNADFFELLRLMEEPLPDKHWTSGRVNDPAIRNFARDAIHKIVPAALQKYFDPQTSDFMGGIFLAKNPSGVSELTAHQDSSHTDEKEYPAVYAWIALCDTTIENGAIQVLPGSHLWGNRHRSLNVPWLFSGMESQLNRFLKPIYMKAGEVLFFDSATIHYSSNNLSKTIRPAINFFIKPKAASFLHHYINKNTPDGKVEVFNVDVDFFYNCDFMQRPPVPPYKFVGYEKKISVSAPIK